MTNGKDIKSKYLPHIPVFERRGDIARRRRLPRTRLRRIAVCLLRAVSRHQQLGSWDKSVQRGTRQLIRCCGIEPTPSNRARLGEGVFQLGEGL